MDRKFLERDGGASLASYSLLGFLIAAGALASVGSVGERVECVFSGIASRVVGGSSECAAGAPSLPVGNQPPLITTASLLTVRHKESYDFSLSASDPDPGDTLSWTWAAAASGTLPPGLVFDDAAGRISGTTTAPGTYQIDFTVSDQDGETDVKSLHLRVQRIKLWPNIGYTNAYMGNAVAMNSDYVLGFSGTGGSGRVFVFDRETGEQVRQIRPAETASDNFGQHMAVSGNLAIFGVPNDDDSGTDSGSAFVFDLPSNTQQMKLLASDGAAGDGFGVVAMAGNYAVIGAPGDDDRGSGSGSVYVFDLTTGDQLHKLTASDGSAGDNFGGAVAISGDYVLVGAYRRSDNGASSGAAYVFDAVSGAQLHKLLPSDGASGDFFGVSVSLSGTSAVIGAEGDDTSTGSAYVFDVASGAQTAKLVASDRAAYDGFGRAVATNGTLAVIGAYQDDDGGSSSGSAYVFDLSTGSQLRKLTASDQSASGWFARSVAMHGDDVVFGAPPDDDGGFNNGAMYVFDAANGEQRAW